MIENQIQRYWKKLRDKYLSYTILKPPAHTYMRQNSVISGKWDLNTEISTYAFYRFHKHKNVYLCLNLVLLKYKN